MDLRQRAAGFGMVEQIPIYRDTGETDVRVSLGLDGSGSCTVSHGLIDLPIQATGDTHIDDHHRHEDVGIAFGQASPCTSVSWMG